MTEQEKDEVIERAPRSRGHPMTRTLIEKLKALKARDERTPKAATLKAGGYVAVYRVMKRSAIMVLLAREESE